jgi:hypothetical protein
MRGLLTALLLTVAGPAGAQAFDESKIKTAPGAYAIAWFIDPGPVTIPDEPLKGMTPFMTTKMFPHKAYVLDAALPLPDGGTPLAPSTQLVGLIADRPLACSNGSVKRSVVQAILLKKGTTRVCVYDENKDGTFDHVFYVTGEALAQGMIPNDAVAIAPVSYREIDRKNSTVQQTVFLYYYGTHSLVGEYSIGFRISDDPKFWVPAKEVYLYSFKKKDIPQSISVFGGKYRVEELVDGRLRLKSEGVQGLTPLYLGKNCCIWNR